MATEQALVEVLEASRAAGFLGPGEPGSHVEHALAYAELWARVQGSPPDRALDLGSGGGVPGLVLATLRWPEAAWTLLDAARRRTTFLTWAVGELGVGDRVQVVHARAEEAGRDATFRGAFDAVFARSFAAPAVTAECAAPLLKVQGMLLVSEPPDDGAQARWPEEPLAELGLQPELVVAGPPRMVALRQVRLAGARWPRRAGIPGKRPLY